MEYEIRMRGKSVMKNTVSTFNFCKFTEIFIEF